MRSLISERPTTAAVVTVVTMRLPHIEDLLAPSSPPSPPTLSLTKWSYRGEGNANLVIAMPEERRIVRLRKCPKHEASDGARIWREVQFSKLIMQPLLGDNVVHIPDVVRIPPRELLRLRQLLHGVRPAHRHHKSEFCEYAAIFPDMCLLPGWRRASPTFCVEIKPKQGWIPVADRRLPKCTFCLNQYLKLCHGVISERSHYCPLNLFSGDAERMKTALRALMVCPQNNFKIFCDGTLLYGEGSTSCTSVLKQWFGNDIKNELLVENLCSVLYGALTANICRSSDSYFDVPRQPIVLQPQPEMSRIPQSLLDEAVSLFDNQTCYLNASELPENCILNRILHVQKLDISGSDLAYQLYSSSQPADYDYVADLINDRASMSDPLHSYLLATTAKDCSIMVAFQEATDFDRNSAIVYAETGAGFVFNIGVSDLDPKPLSCIEKHRRRDLEIVQCCIAAQIERRLCNPDNILSAC